MKKPNGEVRVEGLETIDYLDNLQGRERFTEQGDAVTFESEVDKIYLSTPTKIAILDHEKKRTFVLRKDGLPDAVVWNPWDKKAKAMVDFGDDEYKHMRATGSSDGSSWKLKIENQIHICTDFLVASWDPSLSVNSGRVFFLAGWQIRYWNSNNGVFHGIVI
ncbi:Galactose mutarotase-like superfamily protein [Thalictrum thalictroides]|uniref:Galactose mutarotase-like superfamily protein n=1 Tax=Thalictrum thalictroides TaxID=46969 RepID=A0A7J6WE72_THATH|nr:Galactose mutarotase-like superfamily protein [Thalictrum thalictroides]